MNKNEKELRKWRLLKESGDNDSTQFKYNSILNEKEKSEKREKNESVERELRPSNTPLPIDEMELKDKSQTRNEKQKEKRKKI